MTIDKVATVRHSLSYHTTITGHRINFVYALFSLLFIIFDAVPFLSFPVTDDEGCYYVATKDWTLTMNVLTVIIPFSIIVVFYIYMLVVAYRQVKEISCIVAGEINQSTRFNKKQKK